MPYQRHHSVGQLPELITASDTKYEIFQLFIPSCNGRWVSNKVKSMYARMAYTTFFPRSNHVETFFDVCLDVAVSRFATTGVHGIDKLP